MSSAASRIPTATVLLTGESGVGKNLLAKVIHFSSPRRSRPFLSLNCATLTEELLASELFGHEKGAFTGAVAQKQGLMQIADSGTLYLDEIAEMSPNLQAKLLKAIEEKEFFRVGGTRPVHVDVRFIAATNQNLDRSPGPGHLQKRPLLPSQRHGDQHPAASGTQKRHRAAEQVLPAAALARVPQNGSRASPKRLSRS